MSSAAAASAGTKRPRDAAGGGDGSQHFLSALASAIAEGRKWEEVGEEVRIDGGGSWAFADEIEGFLYNKKPVTVGAVAYTYANWAKLGAKITLAGIKAKRKVVAGVGNGAAILVAYLDGTGPPPVGVAAGGAGRAQKTKVELKEEHAKLKAAKKRAQQDAFDAMDVSPTDGRPRTGAESRKLTDEILKHEMPARTRNSALQRPGTTFTFVLEQCKQIKEKEAEIEQFRRMASKSRKSSSSASSSNPGGASSGAASSASASRRSRSAASSVPIIIVPNASSALLTMINSKDFLGDGSFVAQTTKKQEGVLKPTSLTIERTLGLSPGKTHSYQIVDNPLRLDSRDWDRVVAVIALGKSWQFKGWRWDQPVDLFTQCIGFLLIF